MDEHGAHAGDVGSLKNPAHGIGDGDERGAEAAPLPRIVDSELCEDNHRNCGCRGIPFLSRSGASSCTTLPTTSVW
jgi:hypothetical protein